MNNWKWFISNNQNSYTLGNKNQYGNPAGLIARSQNNGDPGVVVSQLSAVMSKPHFATNNRSLTNFSASTSP